MAKLSAVAAFCIIIASSAFAESFLSRLSNLRRPGSTGGHQQDQDRQEGGRNHRHQSHKSFAESSGWQQQATTTTSVPIETPTTTTATNRAGSNGQRQDLATSETLSSSILDEHGGEPEEGQRTDGVAILEDLVNQFLEKNRNAVQQADAGEHTNHSQSQVSDEQGNYTSKASYRHLKEAASSKPLTVGQYETELTTSADVGSRSSGAGSQTPFMQLVALRTRDEATFETGGDESNDSEDLSYQDAGYQELDRHIQYDRPQVEPIDPAQLRAGNVAAIVSDETNNSGGGGKHLERRSGQADDSSAVTVGGQENSNYTLSVVRKSADEGLLANRQPQTRQAAAPATGGDGSTSDGDNLKNPSEAAANQTRASQENTTIANWEPATQIKPSVSSKSSLSRPTAGDPIVSAAFTTVARAATAIKGVTKMPTTIGSSTPATTNQKQLLVAALEYERRNANGTTPAAASSTRSVQARAMNSSGGQLSPGGPIRTPAHNSRPPYATHDQFRHRLVAGQKNDSPLLGAPEEQSSAEKKRDEVLVGRQHELTADGANDRTDGSQHTASIVYAVGQISSHLNLGDATRQTANSISSGQQQLEEAAAAAPRKGLSALLEDRQLQKLAPASQLVELNPIPAQPGEHPTQQLPFSDRFYFSKENQLFSLFPSPPSTNGGQGDRFAANESGGSKFGALMPTDEAFSDYSAALFLEPPASMLDAKQDNAHRNKQPTGAEFAQRNASQQQLAPTSSNGRDAAAQQAWAPASSTMTAITAAPESENGATDLRLNYLAGSTAPASVQRTTLESVSSQLNANSQLSGGDPGMASPPVFMIENALAEDLDQFRHQQAGTQLMQRRAPMVGAPFAASLINVTAPMVPPLSATEAMESALGDQAGKNILRQVSGFLRAPTQPPALAVSEPQQVDHQMSAGAASGNTLHEKGQVQRQSQYFLPPAGALLEAQQQLMAAQQQPVYSQPANQFSSRPFVESATTNSTSTAAAGESASNSSSSDAADKERMRLDGASSIGSFQLLGSWPKPPMASNSSTGAARQASGFRSPLSSSSASLAAWLSPQHQQQQQQQQQQLQGSHPSSYLSGANLDGSSRAPPTTASGGQYGEPTMTTAASSPSPHAQSGASQAPSSSLGSSSANGFTSSVIHATREPYLTSTTSTSSTPTTNGFITTSSQTGGYGANYSQDSNHRGNGNGNLASIAQVTSSPMNQQQLSTTQSSALSTSAATAQANANNGAASVNNGLNRRLFNLTRVEHISAECSNDLIRTVIVFNGTFKGIIYSSGYVRDPSCMYVNGTGKNKYEFSIRLNQCGTLGRQELHSPTGPNEIRRRDQVMWNTLSIQYNPIIEQEWDEHFRVSCEYGSDFWKTVSFNPFNVETNTGSPVVFTVDPPQCQMEILRGHGMVGPRQEQVSGPVTVGDPLTLLIHMKSEKAGYDILVKNCIAHNGGHQKMQLIDSNGCVVNERFISPFRGTYNDNNLKHVTLYSYLKAFRFTGSPVLYLECEIHMCQSSCPPQMCYWRRLSKRSTPPASTMLGNSTGAGGFDGDPSEGESPETLFLIKTSVIPDDDFEMTTLAPSLTVSDRQAGRQARKMQENKTFAAAGKPAAAEQQGQVSDKVSLFQALEVRQEREPDATPFSLGAPGNFKSSEDADGTESGDHSARNHESRRKKPLVNRNGLRCYSQVEVLAFLITTASILLVALTVTIGCCWREASIRRRERRRLLTAVRISSANLRHCGGGTMSSYQSNSSTSSSSGSSSDSSSYLNGQPAYSSNKLTPSIQPTLGTAPSILSSLQQHQQHSARLKDRLLHSNY